MATAGHDGIVKVWDCRNWKGAVRQWAARGGSAELEWSQKGALAVASGGSVNVSVYTSTSWSPTDVPVTRYTTNRRSSSSLPEPQAPHSS